MKLSQRTENINSQSAINQSLTINVPVTFQDGKSLVSMMKTVNHSSFLHESGDIFLKGIAGYINSGKVSEQDIADCPHKYKQRAQTVYFRFVRIT